MRKSERIDNAQEAMRAVQDDLQARMWTCLPAIVQTFDSVNLTCTAIPAIQGVVQDKNLVSKNVNLPLLVDVPVQYPAGAMTFIYHPLVKGDEVLIIFSSRNIDNWFFNGGIQPQADARQHDLSDGFAIPCVFSKASGLPSKPPASIVALGGLTMGFGSGDYVNIKSGAINLRAASGTAVVQIDASSIRVVLGATSIIMNGTNINLNGNVTITGSLTMNNSAGAGANFTGPVTINGVSFTNHRHSGVTTGASNTGGVV